MGPPGVIFLSKNTGFALKRAKNFPPAAGFYYLQNFKIDLLLLFTQNPPKCFSGSYYLHVKGWVLLTPR